MAQRKNNYAEQEKLEQQFGINKNNSNCNIQAGFNDPNYSDYLKNYTNEKKLQQTSKNVKENVNIQNIKQLQNQVKQIPLPNFDSDDSNKFNGRQYINELNKEPIQFKNIENQKNQNKLPYLQNISQNIQKQFQNKTRSLSPKNSSRNQEFLKNKQNDQQNEQLKQLTSKFQDKISNDPKNSQYCEKQMKQIESLIYKGNAKMASFSIQNLVKTSLKNHGKKGYQFIQEMRFIIKKSCSITLHTLNQFQNFQNCLEILNKLNEILQNAQFGYFPDLIVLLWNNFGCAYRRIGQYQNAHDYFQKAINYMKKYKITSESGITYLNLSSLLSQMGKHEDAYEYGILAKQDCQADINSAINLNIDKEDIQSFREKVNYLAICNYNLGVESEFCKNIQNAISYYTSACEVYEKFQMQEFFAKMYFKFKDHLMKLKEKNLNNLQNVAQGKPMMNISGSNSYQELQFQKNKILQNNKNKYQNAVDKMGPAVVSQGIDYSETQNYIQLQNILKKHTKQNSNDKKKLFYLSDETQYATLQQEQYIIKDKQKQKKSRSPLRIKKYQQGMDKKQMDVQIKSDNEQRYNSYKNEIKTENQEQDIQDSVQYKKFYKKNQQDIIFELKKNPKKQQINSFYYNSDYQKARSQSPNMEYKRRPVGRSPRLNSAKNKMFDSMQQKIPYQQVNQYEEENKFEKINKKEHILGGNSSFEIENQEESSMEIITKQNNFMFNKLNDTKKYKEETNQIKKYRTKKMNKLFQESMDSENSAKSTKTQKLFFQKNQKNDKKNLKTNKMIDSSFLSGNESSFMPRVKNDIDVIGKLSWTSEEFDSFDEQAFKKTRINFLVDQNHYVTEEQVKFDEEARLKKEIELQRQTAEYQLEQKLKNLEMQIQQAEEEKQERLRLQAEEELFNQMQQKMLKLRKINIQKKVDKLLQGFVEKFRQQQKQKQNIKLDNFKQKYYAKKIQKHYRKILHNRKILQERTQKAVKFIKEFQCAQIIKGFFKKLVNQRKKQEFNDYKKFAQNYLKRQKQIVIIQQEFKRVLANQKAKLKRYVKNYQDKLLIKKGIVKLGPTKNSSELYYKYYILQFFQIIKTKTIQVTLESYQNEREIEKQSFQLMIPFSDILKYFNLNEENWQEDPRKNILAQIYCQEHFDFIIREEQDLVIDRYQQEKSKFQLEKLQQKNTLLLQTAQVKKEDSDEEGQGDIDKFKRLKNMMKKLKNNPIYNEKKFRQQIIIIQKCMRGYLVRQKRELQFENETYFKTEKKTFQKLFNGEILTTKYDYEFKENLHHPLISNAKQNFLIIKQGAIPEEAKLELKFGLAQPKLEFNQATQFKFNVRSINTKNYFAIGVAWFNLANYYNYEVPDSKAIQHGFYGIMPDGAILSNHDSINNKQKLSFHYEKGDIINCEIDNKLTQIVFKKQNFDDQFSLPLELREKDFLYPAVLLYNDEDQVEIEGTLVREQRQFDHYNIILGDFNPRDKQNSDYQILIYNKTKIQKFQALNIPNILAQEIKRLPNDKLLEYVYIDIDHQVSMLSDIADEQLMKYAQEGKPIMIKNVSRQQYFKQNQKQITKIQAFYRGKIIREINQLRKLREKNLENSQCTILIAKSFYVIDNVYQYVLLIYVDEVFTKILIKAVKIEPHLIDRSKQEVFEVVQKLKSFLGLIMLKFYAQILAEKTEIKRRNQKILLVTPNIEEIISEYESKIGISQEDQIENMKTHISIKRKQQLRKSLRQKFCNNNVIPQIQNPNPKYHFIEDEDIKGLINKEIQKLEYKKKTVINSNQHNQIISILHQKSQQSSDQNDEFQKKSFQYVQDQDYENLNIDVFQFNEVFEIKEERIMQDIQILGSAIRKIFKACRKYYMYKRLKIRRDYKDRGTEIEDDFQKREQELTQNQLRFLYRCLATNQGQPFIKLEIYNNILEKSFIFIGRELKKLRIIQKIALNWNLVGLTDKFESQEYSYQIKQLLRVIQQNVRKSSSKISIQYQQKQHDSKASLTFTPDDQYQQKFNYTDFQTDKYVVQLSQFKEKKSPQINNLKLLFTFYYHILKKNIIVIIQGSLIKFTRSTIIIQIEKYSEALYDNIQQILGPNIQKQGGPNNIQVHKLQELFRPQIHFIRRFIELQIEIKSIKMELNQQIYEKEQKIQAIKCLQKYFKSTIIRQKFVQMQKSSFKQVFNIKKLLYISLDMMYEGYAYYSKQDFTITIKGKKYSRQLVGSITQFQVQHGLDSGVRIGKGINSKILKIEEQDLQDLPISSIRVKLRYYTDAVFENYVQKEIRLDEEKQYQKKKQQAFSRLENIIYIQRQWKKKIRIREIIWNQSIMIKNKRKEEALGKLHFKYLTYLNEKYILLEIREKENYLIFNGFDYFNRGHKFKGIYDLNSKKHQKNIEKNETLLDFLLKRMYLNDTETKFEFNLDISNQQILEEESAIKMLHYNQKSYNRNLFKFNTYYKQKEKLQIKTQMDQEELDPLKEQHPTVQLNVDLNALPDLKKKIKLYGSKQQALKEVADQFVNGIKLNKQGSIILDSSNIDPNFVQISEQNLKKVVKRSQLVNTKKQIKTLQNMLDKEQIKRFTKILNKGIKMDSRKKFLVQIKLVEVPLKSIKNISADNVFSKAERIFVIDARTIDNSQQFDWKMSTEEYEKLTQEPNWELAAKKLITMIHLADQRVIIELFDDSVKIEDFQDKPENIVIISKPKVLIMQQQLRKTRFQIKFRRHQQFLKDLGGQVIGKKIGTIEDQEYIITVVLAKGQNGNKCYYILTWDIRDFSKMSTQLNWNEKIENLIPNDVLLENILQNLFILQENHQKSLVLNIKFVDNLIIEYEKLYDDL